MTVRYHSLTVALETNMRDDAAELLIAAILQLRGVVGVEGNVADPSSFVHEVRTHAKLGNLLNGIAQAIIRGGIDETTRMLEDVKARPII